MSPDNDFPWSGGVSEGRGRLVKKADIENYTREQNETKKIKNVFREDSLEKKINDESEDELQKGLRLSRNYLIFQARSVLKFIQARADLFLYNYRRLPKIWRNSGRNFIFAEFAQKNITGIARRICRARGIFNPLQLIFVVIIIFLNDV